MRKLLEKCAEIIPLYLVLSDDENYAGQKLLEEIQAKLAEPEQVKLERSAKDYGGGSGREIFESDLFRVVLWGMSKGNRTSVEVKLADRMDIQFDGHHRLLSDDECMAQLTTAEILTIIENQKAESFKEGQRSKASEIRNALNIY
jgi:hypothetical protein